MVQEVLLGNQTPLKRSIQPVFQTSNQTHCIKPNAPHGFAQLKVGTEGAIEGIELKQPIIQLNAHDECRRRLQTPFQTSAPVPGFDFPGQLIVFSAAVNAPVPSEIKPQLDLADLFGQFQLPALAVGSVAVGLGQQALKARVYALQGKTA